jgi:hypothetical protein
MACARTTDAAAVCQEQRIVHVPRVSLLLRRPCLQIAVQIALVIAKAARFDFPQQWPTLFNDLLAGVSNSSAAPAGQQLSQQQQVLLVRRTYFVLHHVLKELSSKRLAADQKAFAQVCCGVLLCAGVCVGVCWQQHPLRQVQVVGAVGVMTLPMQSC